MQQFIFLFSILLVFTSCNSHKKETKHTTEEELSTAEKIVEASGFENWDDVTQIDFTFNVNRDTAHFERSWSWKPKTDDVMLISGNDTISYNRKSIDSTSLNADKGFINDKYWLLAPFQLVWDTGTSITYPIKEIAPISKKEMNKITLTYSSKGGYTPGDAYDFYYGDDFVVKEWIYRQGNAKEPSMVTTWEDYENFNGIHISKTHKKPDSNWKLYFTNIRVTK